jgi:hypothetical protein
LSRAECQLQSFVHSCPGSNIESIQTLDDGTVIKSSETLNFIKRLLLNEQSLNIMDATTCSGFYRRGAKMLEVLCEYETGAFTIDPFTLKVRRPSKPMRRAMQKLLKKTGVVVDDSAIQ